MRILRQLPNHLIPLSRLLLAAGVCAALLSPGCGKKTVEPKTKTGDGKTVADAKTGEGKSKTDQSTGAVPAGKSAKAGTPEAEVYAALDGAIAAAKKYDVKTFFDQYAPVEELQMARRRYGGTAGLARFASSRPKMLKELFDGQLLPMVQGARRTKPVFNADRTVARFKVVSAKAGVVKLTSSPLLVEKHKQPAVSGYGADLKAAVQQAAADLAAGKIAAFLAAMLPVSELKLNDVAELAKRLNAAPAVTKQMVADLKRLDSKTPKLDQGGTVAVFEVVVASPPVKKGDAQPKPVTRVFKFQKSGGHWRLFDNTTALQKSSREMSRKLAGKFETVTMEKIGTQWRLSSDAERFGGKTRADKTYDKTRAYKTYDKTYDPKESFKTPAPPRRRFEKTPAKTIDDKKD